MTAFFLNLLTFAIVLEPEFVLVLFQSDANELTATMRACLGEELLDGSLDRTL